jgi:hypothetical protein
LRNFILTSNVKMPMKLKTTDDGSGTREAVKVPDCELVMFLLELKSAATHVPLGQKNSWIFWGVGAVPFGRRAVKNSEKPPL